MKKPAESIQVSPDASPETEPAKKRPYVAPRLERKRAVERVTLLSGMGAMGVGAVNMMNLSFFRVCLSSGSRFT